MKLEYLDKAIELHKISGIDLIMLYNVIWLYSKYKWIRSKLKGDLKK